ncbi:ac120 [Erannis ankeraria nucleopolyhedrovirus]|uniref:ac120 n=1 Tax=Erannis ankeraria nucleopolyhedrovirus TaxID=2913600 RepID=UPI00117A0511|nr:ac120 [Erannis ankeraria nucleopolyhedrovirus]UJZ89062.1 ac120 [Erannis ankeraria nucleopolyhedrovirus]
MENANEAMYLAGQYNLTSMYCKAIDCYTLAIHFLNRAIDKTNLQRVETLIKFCTMQINIIQQKIKDNENIFLKKRVLIQSKH